MFQIVAFGAGDGEGDVNCDASSAQIGSVEGSRGPQAAVQRSVIVVWCLLQLLSSAVLRGAHPGGHPDAHPGDRAVTGPAPGPC